MDDLDLKLKLISGEPIKIDGFGEVKPMTIREIIGRGYMNYLARLNIFVIEIDDLLGDEADKQELGLNVFDILVQHAGEEVKNELVKSLELFLNDTVKVIPRTGIIIIGEDSIIDRNNFDKIREAIKWQNGLKKFKEEESEADATDEARKILDKIKKANEIKKKYKKDDEDGEGDLDLSEIISAVSSKSHSINKLNVFDLTLFQLYDEFNRLELIDQYDIGIKSMLAGAKNVKLKHWSSKTLG